MPGYVPRQVDGALARPSAGVSANGVGGSLDRVKGGCCYPSPTRIVTILASILPPRPSPLCCANLLSRTEHRLRQTRDRLVFLETRDGGCSLCSRLGKHRADCPVQQPLYNPARIVILLQYNSTQPCTYISYRWQTRREACPQTRISSNPLSIYVDRLLGAKGKQVLKLPYMESRWNMTSNILPICRRDEEVVDWYGGVRAGAMDNLERGRAP